MFFLAFYTLPSTVDTLCTSAQATDSTLGPVNFILPLWFVSSKTMNAVLIEYSTEYFLFVYIISTILSLCLSSLFFFQNLS